MRDIYGAYAGHIRLREIRQEPSQGRFRGIGSSRTDLPPEYLNLLELNLLSSSGFVLMFERLAYN
jgi:hypothetical protein